MKAASDLIRLFGARTQAQASSIAVLVDKDTEGASTKSNCTREEEEEKAEEEKDRLHALQEENASLVQRLAQANAELLEQKERHEAVQAELCQGFTNALLALQGHGPIPAIADGSDVSLYRSGTGNLGPDWV